MPVRQKGNRHSSLTGRKFLSEESSANIWTANGFLQSASEEIMQNKTLTF